MEGLPHNDDSSRWRIRLVVIAVAILAIVVVIAIVYGSIRVAFGPLMARYCYYPRGHSLAMKGEFDRAIADFSEAIRLDPNYHDARFARGYVRSQQKQFDPAIADYSETIRLNPKYAAAYVNRGSAYLENHEYSKAIADLSHAIRLEPGNAYAHNSIAWIWTFCSDPAFRDKEHAVESATLACELSDWKVPAFMETLAGACAQSGDFAAAAKWQTKANGLYENSAEREAGEQRLANYRLSQ